MAGDCTIECQLSMGMGLTTRSRVAAAISLAVEWHGFHSSGSTIAPEEEVLQVLAHNRFTLRGTTLQPTYSAGTTDIRIVIVYAGAPTPATLDSPASLSR